MGAWNPWAELKYRHDIEFGIGPVPAGRKAMSVDYPGQPVIAMAAGLSQVERNAALAHELVHLERGTHCRATDRRLLVREEEAVEDVVADRLVPRVELQEFWVRAEQTGQHVHPHEVAEHFHVPEELAERAMRRLIDRYR